MEVELEVIMCTRRSWSILRLTGGKMTFGVPGPGDGPQSMSLVGQAGRQAWAVGEADMGLFGIRPTARAGVVMSGPAPPLPSHCPGSRTERLQGQEMGGTRSPGAWPPDKCSESGRVMSPPSQSGEGQEVNKALGTE